MRKALYILLPFSTALALRLYPTFLSGLPFSCDAWPPIRNVVLLMENTPVDIGNRSLFDGYNNYWPANSIFGAVVSQVIGISPMVSMALAVPTAAALAVPIFYALVEKLSGSRSLAFFASTILATAFPYVLFTAGVTKETYANPIYMLAILVFFSCGAWRKTLLFTLVSAALVMSHHLTPLVTLSILTSIALSKSFNNFRRGLDFNKLDFILVSIMAITIILYFVVFAHAGFNWVLSISDWISAASYQAVAFAITLYLAFKPHKPSNSRLIKALIATALPLTILLLCVKRPILPGAPILPSRYIVYAIPFIIASPSAALGLGKAHNISCNNGLTHIFWIAPILGLEGYAVFGDSPLGLGLAYRTLNFLWPPLTLICAFGIHRLCTAAEETCRKTLMKISAIAILASFTVLSCYSVYAAVSLQERYMGYFWLYRVQEYEGALWVSKFINQTVAGDVKVSYLLKGYFNVAVDVLHGLQYLTGENSKPQTLFTYREMLNNGYVLYEGYSVDLPANWMETVHELNHVYSNGLTEVYTG